MKSKAVARFSIPLPALVIVAGLCLMSTGILGASQFSGNFRRGDGKSALKAIKKDGNYSRRIIATGCNYSGHG